MPSNIITIRLSDGDRELLERIGDLLENFTLAQPEEPVAKPPVAKPTAEEVAPSEQSTYTAADIQAKVQKLATPTSGKRDAVRALVKEYADRVSLIPEAKYNEVMARLIELEEG